MDHLRKRRDFLAAAKAERAGAASFLMQGRDRGDAGTIRVGFTVTKKTGNAVVRNRIRRRLREAVRRVLPEAGQAGFDYVLVAREAALRTPFDALVREIERSVRKVHTPRSNAPHGARKAGGRPERRTSSGPSPEVASTEVAGAAAGAPEAPSDDIKPTPADGGPPA
ncbi:ribonuclease P protein component [Xanthobacter autotrophicus]|uniref:ribonuclease P protein component n=1 Tax=Xanthobacter TaxID=279 RepID=UPI0024AC0631|nr:ribonuclease P protein component [Xanthobacter autotrophicus]MDI4666084.1 ribonuclease P protein component [Xanthobacter autotrophicus]